MIDHLDERFMKRALRLAEKGLGSTSPNPPVGAVVVRDGKVQGEGHHERAGSAHAEVVALAHAGASAEGSTLYVTLEPCCHWGRTAPCVDAIAKAKVARVVIGAIDPNPRVLGKGIRELQRAGIAVDRGVLEAEAKALIRGYSKHVVSGLPFVTMKYAMTLDGKIATRAGASRWISGSQARRRVHQIRSRMDAVIVGVGTVLKDDPELSCRTWEWDQDQAPAKQPVRVVVDSSCRTPPSARVLRRLPEELVHPGSAARRMGAHVLVATTDAAPSDRVAALEEAGARVLRLGPPGPDGRVRVDQLLKHLGDMGVVSALLEGGAALNGAFVSAGAFDEVLAFVCPVIAGGASAPGPVGDPGAESLEDAPKLEIDAVEDVGGDILVVARPRRDAVERAGA